MKIAPPLEQRPLVFVALLSGAGVLLGVYAPYAPVLYGGAALLGLLVAGMLKKAGRCGMLGILAATLFLMALLSGAAAHPDLPPEGMYQVAAVVREDAKTDPNDAFHVKVRLRDVRLTDAAGQKTNLMGAYWTYYREEGSPLPQAGQVVTLSAKLYRPQGQQNPEGFDFRLYLLREGMTAGFYGADGLTLVSQQMDLHTAAISLRKMLSSRLDTLFGAHSALPKALLLGEREELPKEMSDAFARAGIAHVLAISGLHVGLLAGALLLLLKRFLYPKTRAVVIGVFLLFYCWLLDFSPTVVRASILMLCGLFSRAYGRQADSLSVLSLSFLLILLVQPLDLFSSGFQLSFCAVLGILLLQKGFGRLFAPLRSKRMRSALTVTFAATFGTLIPVTLIFHRLSLIGLALNPFVCMALAVLLPAYAGTLIVGLISPPVGMLIGSALGAATGLAEELIGWLGALDFAAVQVPSIPLSLLPALALAMYLVSPYTTLCVKKRVLLFCAALIVGAGVHLLTLDRGVSYTQWALGNADCAVIQDGRETVVVDAGENASDLCEYLLAKGRKIDTLVLTHLHVDHAGGVQDLLDAQIPIGRVLLPTGASRQQIAKESQDLLARLSALGIPLIEVAAGDSFQTARTSFSVLWPVSSTVRSAQDPNLYAMALLLNLNGARVYLASDLSGLYDVYAAEKADVLKVSHHGGANETTRAFLDAVCPTVALISANGQSNPSEKVLDRLKEKQCAVYVTGECGAVRMDATLLGLRVRPFCKQ